MEGNLLPKSLFCLMALSIMAAAISCARPAPPPEIKKQPAKPAAKPAAKSAEEPGDKKAESASKTEKLAGLDELSEADRALALKQKVCPVTDDVLGEHGKPVKITIKEQVVFLCCPACEETIKKDPDKYLAKLKPAEGGAK